MKQVMARRGLGKPIGSMTQYDKIRVGRGTKNATSIIRTSHQWHCSTTSCLAAGMSIRKMH